MSLTATIIGERAGQLTAACDRLVRPEITDARTREHQRRFIATVLAAPFIAGLALCMTMPSLFGIPLTVAAVSGTFGLSWSLALMVAWLGSTDIAEKLAFALGVAFSTAVVAIAGGVASPMFLLAFAPAIEAALLRGGAKAMRASAIATAGMIAVLIAASAGGTLAVAGSAWQWLVIAAYGASVLPRVTSLLRAREDAARAATAAIAGLEDEALVLAISQAGEVTDIHRDTAGFINVPTDMLLGRGLFERIHVADRVTYLCALADVKRGAPHSAAEVRLRLPAGSPPEQAPRYLPVTIRFAADGERAGACVATIRDDSRHAALREALEAERERADSTEAAKKRFLATVSHELRTPLNAIIGFSEMMRRGMLGEFADPRQREYVALIEESGNHLLSVVNAILDVSKIESGSYAVNCEPFAVAEAVELCRSMMTGHAAAKQIELETRIAASVGEIQGDRRAIQQMLLNLLSNAIKFTPQSGHISIEASRLGSMLQIRVSDNGIGIADSDLTRLGEPFVQVQNDLTRQFEGTGLGLSIVKGLVKLHEGSMSVESAPGEGTTVTIGLPVAGPTGAMEKVSVLHNPANQAKKEETDGSFRKIA